MTKQAPISPPLILDDLERFAAPGLVASMDAMTLGAFVRLLSYAWQQEPPCSLPADEGLLAFVARTTAPGEWERVRPVILLAFSPNPNHQLPDPVNGDRTRLVNAVARGIFDQIAAERQSVSEAQRAKANARWKKPPDAGGMPAASPGMPVASIRHPAPSVRFDSSLSLDRSIQTNESPRSSERPESEGNVIAQLGDRARAIGDERIADWKRRQVLDLLQKAIVGWRNLGLTDYPISSAGRLASGEWSEPARVEAVLEDIAGQIAAKRMRNPVGYLLCGLGLAENSKRVLRPAEIPLQLAQKWAAAEASHRKTLEAVSAIQAAANRIRSQQPSPTAQAGGAC